MNLSDYQKSGNAYNKTITPYPRFSLLAGKLPKVPGLSEFPISGDYIYKQTEKFIESFYGRKHALITQNGYLTRDPLTNYGETAYQQTSNFNYDAFRQSLGSVPFQYEGHLPNLVRATQGDNNIAFHSDGVENYQTSFVYNLPFNYSKKTGAKSIRFSGPKESPYEGKIVDSTSTDFGNVVDSEGMKYKVFNFKKEQYVYLFADMTLPPATSNGYADSYQEKINRLKLDFLSLFYTIDQKREGYEYQIKDLSFSDKFNPTSLELEPNNFLFFEGKGSPWDYDRVIRTSTSPKSIIDNNPQDWYSDGMMGTSLSEKNKEIYSIAFKTLKDVEDKTYTDLSFDVESEINLSTFVPVVKPGQGISFVPSQEKLQTASGIPVNPIAMDGGSPLDQAYLTADVTSKYNFLNSIWENALPKMPETVIPNIYRQTVMDPLAKDLTGLFEGLANKVNNCENEAALLKLGSDTKIIYIDNQKLMEQANSTKNKYPMYNEIEFDIFSNANSEINSILLESGIGEDFLNTLLTYIYGPKANMENAQEIGGSYDAAFTKASKDIQKLGMLDVLTKVYREDRFVSFKPSLSSPSTDPAASYKTSDLVYYDFENWFQNYINGLEIEGFETPPNSSAIPIINEKNYKNYTTKFRYPNAGTPFETGGPLIAGVMSDIPDLKDIFFEKMRTLNEIMSKQNSYSEPIMYKIEKFDERDNSIQTIFMPHYPNMDNPDVKDFIYGNETASSVNTAKMRYIDTQVKYGHVYRYKITQLRIVVGTDYRYVFSTNKKSNKRAYQRGYGSIYAMDRIMSPLRFAKFDTYPESALTNIDSNNTVIESNEDLDLGSTIANFTFYTANQMDVQDKDHNTDQGFASSNGVQIVEKNILPQDTANEDKKLAVFKSIMYPNIKIVEVPYYEEVVVVADFPPLPPNVNFNPLVGKGSKILMTFEHQVGDREEVPIAYNKKEKSIFNLIRTAQNRNFKGADGKFVKPSIRFKSDDFPIRYIIYTLETPPSGYKDFESGRKRGLSTEKATARIEDLVPNKTYYYMFKTEDVHRNISNPSPVYAVQMTLNSGVYFPVVSIYEFQKESIGEKFKQFQQYLKIEASVIQRIVNRDKSEINSGTSNTSLPVLGIGNTSLWNEKKFKFRIISKHTGKAVDLNIRFKTNHTEPIKPIETC